MQNIGINPSGHGLEHHGLRNIRAAYWNLGVASLVEHAIKREEGILASGGALVVRTGKYTGRSPHDKFIVHDPEMEERINWGPVNQSIAPDRFDALLQRVLAFYQGRDVFVQDCYVGADRRYSVPIRAVTQYAWHSIFARQVFIRPDRSETHDHIPEFVILSAPGFKADPVADGTRSEAFIIVSFSKRLVLIGGSEYAGEMKKSIFSILNYLLPERGILSMHCAANMGTEGDTALFFGLSGTGKTSLSADPERYLIGDDEHGWSDKGIFNFEGGCYAKCIRLSKENEPQIWNAIRFSSVLENVVVDPETRIMNYNDDSYTENTRAAYPLHFIDNAVIPSIGVHPNHIFFLTCDAFGVLPPISRLSHEQAMQQFLLGYTAKVAGTETGITQPQVTFSTCFGAPFLPLPPKVYADLLGKKLKRHGSQVWLVNTGWSGGPFGIGSRISIPYTRAMVRAALKGSLNTVDYRMDPIFKLEAPRTCPGVPAVVLDTRRTWKDKKAYDAQARHLAAMWEEQFHKAK